MRSPLISTRELAAVLSDPAWFVADCRFELGDPGAGIAAWRAGHVPAAVHVDLERHLAAPVTPATGRHPLPSPAAFARTLGGIGIGNGTRVACYDAGSGAFAARLWWMLRWLGHDDVAVLDGGFKSWTDEGRPVSTDATPSRPPATFVPRPRPEMVLDTEGVLR
ncbi:MAG TPA: rhodanese-like domain-containing protein, partial [Steroidobacteraceae bacterium]|nr:rhodanese-like domain-containing protein [Steroidobacteraceae bacterium]